MDDRKRKPWMMDYEEHLGGTQNGSVGNAASFQKPREEAGAGSASREKEGVLCQNLRCVDR